MAGVVSVRLAGHECHAASTHKYLSTTAWRSARTPCRCRAKPSYFLSNLERRDSNEVAFPFQQEANMKLIIGKPDDTEIVLAEQAQGVWRPNPNLSTEMTTFLQGADPEQFEMWVEEPE
jgi:hypothetical protein